MQRVERAGSERIAMRGARVAGKVAADERFEVAVRLRRCAVLPPAKGSAATSPLGIMAVYAAKAGWDTCTGWGTPDGDVLRKALEVT